MNNVIYRKAMQNLGNTISLKLVNNEKDYLRLFYVHYIETKLYVAQNTWHNLVTIQKSKITLTLKKPAYIGMCMLDLSKVLMYKFCYDYIKNKYGSNSRLLFRDTDSLMYEVNGEEQKSISY